KAETRRTEVSGIDYKLIKLSLCEVGSANRCARNLSRSRGDCKTNLRLDLIAQFLGLIKKKVVDNGLITNCKPDDIPALNEKPIEDFVERNMQGSEQQREKSELLR